MKPDSQTQRKWCARLKIERERRAAERDRKRKRSMGPAFIDSFSHPCSRYPPSAAADKLYEGRSNFPHRPVHSARLLHALQKWLSLRKQEILIWLSVHCRSPVYLLFLIYNTIILNQFSLRLQYLEEDHKIFWHRLESHSNWCKISNLGSPRSWILHYRISEIYQCSIGL